MLIPATLILLVTSGSIASAKVIDLKFVQACMQQTKAEIEVIRAV
jgi:hypothetical protein